MKAQTVLGKIDAKDMGFTYVHEHLWCYPPPHQKDRDLELSKFYSSLEELNIFASVGGKTLVDASTLDYGRDAGKLVRMSKESGVNVIAVTGFNKYQYFPEWVRSITEERLVERLVYDLTIGMDGTNACAGIIKCGASYYRINDLEEKVLIAGIEAQRQTKAPMWIHTEVGTMGHEIVDILIKNNVDLSTVVLGHIDRNLDSGYILSLLERGVGIQFDGIGKIKYYPDSERLTVLKAIKENGFLKQLFVSGDMGRQEYLAGYGGGPGFAFIKTKFIPRMIKEIGFSDTDISQVFVSNPANWLGSFV